MTDQEPELSGASLAARLARLTGVRVTGCAPAGTQHGVRHHRATLADGRELFVKQGPAVQIAAEAAGLRWLGEARAAAVPGVVAAGGDLLALPLLPAGHADPMAARRFGADLAALHRSGAPAFGAAWTGFIAGLPLPNEAAGDWPDWYVRHRVLPYLRIAMDAGWLGPADARLIESAAGRAADLAGPAEPPSRIHGDCWSGNVLWSGGRGWLIDPAAHGGHRETDLAMLALFGAPYLSQILAGYQETAALAGGWQARVPLHQLHPLLVHVCLFGAGYREEVLAAARAVLTA